MAVMASSLTPKWILLPSGVSFEKSPFPFIKVLLEGARSADPPNKFGIFSAIWFNSFPDRLLVASDLALLAQKSSSSSNCLPSPVS